MWQFLAMDISHAAKLPHVKGVYTYTQKYKRKRKGGRERERESKIKNTKRLRE